MCLWQFDIETNQAKVERGLKNEEKIVGNGNGTHGNSRSAFRMRRQRR